MAFLDENYLLENESAKKIYEQVKDLPILDAHNHGDVEEIVSNEGWNDIWEVEAETDHYVWEILRKRGVPEEKITGNASNKEKWLALAKIFPEIAGNPTYEWIHLDLKRRFGIDELISEHTADMIWEKTKAALATEAMKPVSLLKAMNVKVMCTTDEPFSPLEDHQKAKDEIDGVSILPTWRPDKAMNIEKDIWKGFVDKIGERFDEDTSDLSAFLTAMQKSHDFFVENGCIASDHGITEPYSYFVEDKVAATIHDKAYKGEELSEKEVKDYKAYILVKFGEMNVESNWVTQLHIGAVRDYNETLFETLGPDTGGDLSTNSIEIVDNLKYLLNKLDGSKVVLYCLDPTHWPTLATISRAFRNVSLGAAWWFNDSPYGMEEQLKYISTVDLLSNFAGMVSDSRKLISYGSRMEMFRRSMCNAIGKMVDRGQIPFHIASDLAYGLTYRQPNELFFND